MSEEQRCDWSDLYVSECSHCRGLDTSHGADLPRLDVGSGRGFESSYSSRCAECGESIEVGTTITKHDGTYVHYGCHPANQS